MQCAHWESWGQEGIEQTSRTSGRELEGVHLPPDRYGNWK